jgi:membrane protease YdiL (CAAX protease family)
MDLGALTGGDPASIEIVATYPTWRAAFAILISFLPLLLATLLTYRALIDREIFHLFSAISVFRFTRVLWGAVVMSGLLLALTLPDLLINRGSYTWRFELSAYLPYLLIALTLIPLQSSAEELFFRGWLQQWIDNGRRPIWLISTISALIFAAPHLANPEVADQLLLATVGYGATGFMLAWVTARDKTLEIALGAHGANNILSGLLISSTNSALPSVSLWSTPEVNWGWSSLSALAIIPIFIWLTKKR